MRKQIETGIPVSDQVNQRSFSQAIFVTVTLAIIMGGIWSLYMSNAPYHPEVSRSEGGITLNSD